MKKEFPLIVRAVTTRLSALQNKVVRQGRVAFALLFLAPFALFIIPSSPGMLDLLFLLNIVLSLAILLRGLFAKTAKELFVFPMLLLLTTLFRLSLNVSSTRLILAQGHEGSDRAGHVIEAFGQVVAQGEFIVGLIVFSVIALANFLVITKGAARVAEVSARFSLDSLPGRQLAIDSDLRAGVITREEGERRRTLLDQESQFYGAMDGAMKFVQGDAIACLLIVVVNGVGGVLFGVIRHSLDFATAVNQYGVMALGDGLASVLPALLLSVSAGVIVTNAGSQAEAQKETKESLGFFSDPRALLVAAGSTFLIGLLVQFPLFPLFLVSVVIGGVGWGIDFRRRSGDPGRLRAELRAWESKSRTLEPIVIELSKPLLSEYLLKAEGEELPLLPEIEALRENHYAQRGVWLPAVSVVQQEELGSTQFRIKIRDRVVRIGHLHTEAVLVPLSPATLGILGVKSLGTTPHPIDQRLCSWVSEPPIESLNSLGVKVLLPYQVLALEVVGAAMSVVGEVFGVDETKLLVEQLHRHHRGLVDEVFASQMVSYSELAELLRRLAREGVSIRDLKLIFEAIAAYSCMRPGNDEKEGRIDELHNFIRASISRVIVGDLLAPGGKLRVFLLSSSVEAEFRSALPLWDRTQKFPPLDPSVETGLRQSVSKIMAPVLDRGALPLVILCAADIRQAVQEVIASQVGGYDCVRTLAFEELSGRYQAESVGLLAA